MTPDPEILDALVRQALGARPTDVTMLPGGASPREFFRVSTPGGSAIAMVVPENVPAPRFAFVEVAALLASRGIRVPKVLGEARDAGLLLVEDLGDETLAAFLERAPRRREEVYALAVRDLANAQAALTELPADSVVRTRAFDETLLRWELEHFREWGLEASGVTLSADERTSFDGIADRLSRRIASWPRSFVHRDYQSTNLMVRPAAMAGSIELVWIDFQDAMLGPRVYDLVALLRDSYIDLEEPFVRARLEEYAAARALGADDGQALAREFDLVTVQRKLKDAGRFVFIDRVRGNGRFLRFVGSTLAMVRTTLERLADEPDMRALGALVARAKSEIQAH